MEKQTNHIKFLIHGKISTTRKWLDLFIYFCNRSITIDFAWAIRILLFVHLFKFHLTILYQVHIYTQHLSILWYSVSWCKESLRKAWFVLKWNIMEVVRYINADTYQQKISWRLLQYGQVFMCVEDVIILLLWIL